MAVNLGYDRYIVEVRENGLQSEWEDITNDNIK